MGNTLSLLYKRIQFSTDSYLKNPEAEAHAKQVAKQQAQDEAAAKRKAALNESKAELKAKNEEAKKEAEDLARRSKVSSPSEMLGKAAKRIMNVFGTLLIVGLGLYAGKLEANKAIGYSVSMRIVSFIYGAIFFFAVIPRTLYDRYALDKKIPDYAPLPIWNYVPNGRIERIFLGLFSYVEDANSIAAREDVMRLYKDGFTGQTTPPIVAKPVPVVAPVAGAPVAGAPVAAAVATPVATPVAAPVATPVAKPVTKMER